MTSQDPAIYTTTNYDRDSIALVELAIQQLKAGNAEKHIAGSLDSRLQERYATFAMLIKSPHA